MELPRAKNLYRIGWRAGFLTVQFRGRPARYLFGPGVEREDVDKLMRSPFPDALFSKLRAKHGWPCKKMEE